MRPLARYATTATLARSGGEAAGPGLLVAVVALGGTVTEAALLVAALTAAAAVAGPVVGAVLDHSPRPARVLAGSLGLYAGALALIAALLLHWPPLVAVPVALLGGLGQPATTGAWTAQLSFVLPPDRLARGYAVDAGTYNLAALAGPALAAAALGVAAVAPVLVPVVLIAAGLATMPLVPLGRRARAAAAAGRPGWSDVVDGLRSLGATPALLRTTVVTTVGFAGQAALIVSAPVVAQQLTGALGFTGVLLATLAAAGLVASLVITRRPIGRPDRAITAAQVVIAAAMVVVALAPSVPVALVGAAVFGVGDTVLITAMFQIRARDTAPAVRARVFTTAASLRTGAAAVATAGFGLLIGAGTGTVLALGAAVQLVALAAGAAAGTSRATAP